MKKLILLLAIAGFFMQAHAQKLMATDVPTVVTDAFNKAHPSIKVVDWSLDGNYYEARYMTDKVYRSVTYDATGKLIETGEKIVVTSLPAPALEYLKINYTEEIVKETSKNTDANGIETYEAEVKGLDLIFDSEGNFVRLVEN